MELEDLFLVMENAPRKFALLPKILVLNFLKYQKYPNHKTHSNPFHGRPTLPINQKNNFVMNKRVNFVTIFS